MADIRSRLPTRRTVFRVISISVLVLFVALAALSIYVYKQSVGRFEVRRLSLPTRIFADYTPLRPETGLQRDDLLEKLERLGYRETQTLAQAGDFVPGKQQLDIFTRAFTHPSGRHESQPLRVVFDGNAIAEVVAVRESRPVETAALEPELLTSILSDELENRRPITLDQAPKHLQEAVVVTEDVRFWRHPGVDPFGIFRALFRNIRAKGVAEGGSTLTQQLVKNYYLTSERTMRRKIVEAFMAVILDAKYSKREILEAYLNDIYLGRNRSISILGVGEASRFYFGKPVSEIDVAEAALLAGMIRSPNNNSPFANPERAIERRNTVLGLMLKEKKIDQATYEKAKSKSLPRRPTRDRSGLTSIPFYVDRVLQEIARDYGIEDVKGRGLQIYTAIDLSAQDSAARTLETGLRNLERSTRRLRRAQNPLEGVILHVDVPTGEIRALVGGRNYDRSQFNRALNAKRQVGSLFKPFVYLTAFEPSLSNKNITPATLVSDTRFVLKRRFSDDWSPRNYDGKYNGTVTVRTALEQSLNSASVRIGLACGIEPIVKTARTLGVAAEMDEQPSMILGAVGVPPIEMAESYSTIARQGARMPLRTIRFVTNDRGRVVAGAGEAKPVQVFPARDVYLMTNVMRGVLDRGTAAASRRMGFKRVAAGKTGTTNDKRDAWFIGFTPQTLALTWVGFDDNSPTGLSGSDAAVPIWTRYMLAVTGAQPNREFAVPEGMVYASIDRTSGGRLSPQCPPNVSFDEVFKSGTEPGFLCPLHGAAPQLPPLDEFGNPIALDTAATSTEAGFPPIDMGVPPPPPLPPPTPPEGTLTGGVFRTDTAPPTPPAREPEPARPPEPAEPPPPATDTAEPPPPPTNTSPPTNT